MRILFIENSFQKGGSFQSLNLIAENLVQDHQISIVYSHYKSHEHVKKDKINYVYVKDARGLLNFSSRVLFKLNDHAGLNLIEKAGSYFESFRIRQYKDIINRLNPDLIVFNNTPYIDHKFIKASSGYSCRKICHLRLSNKKSIFNQRGFRDIISTEIDRFIANSHAVKQSWAGEWGIEEDKIHVIHNAVHDIKEDVSAAIVNQIKERNNTVKVACIGRINDEKGQEFLLETLLRNRNILNEATFFFIGDGPLTGKLKSKTKSQGLKEEIRFLGNVPNARNYLPLFDMTILPSRCEPFGNVILESMQAGVPVIATDCCGPKEIITDGHDGILVPYGDHSRLLDAIQMLKNDKKLGSFISNNAMITFNDRFSKQEFMRKLTHAYFE